MLYEVITLACVPNTSEEGESYRKAMFAALNYAWSNRQMLTHWTRKSFERVFNQSESDLDMKLVYDVAHNIAKVEKHKINGEERKVVVHRKGATRAFPADRDEVPLKYRHLGQPVLVPGVITSYSIHYTKLYDSVYLVFFNLGNIVCNIIY